MIINAGKSSSDPVQEKLRQSKKLWNKDVSSFIDDLINFKKMMNGQPSKFFKEKSFIKDPIPADPVTIIGVLSSDFQELAQKGSAIIQQQSAYSNTRKKKQPKSTITNIVAPTPSTNLSQQLSASLDKYELISMGSTHFSRFFTRLLNPAIGKSPAARIRKYRMSLLNTSADIYKNLKKLQAEVVGSSPESIFVSSKVFSRIEDNWIFLMKGFDTFKESMPDTNLGGNLSSNKNTSTTEKSVENAAAVVKDEIDLIIEDYKKYISNFLDIDHKNLNKLILNFISLKEDLSLGDDDKKQIKLISLKKSIIEEYKKILSTLNNEYHVNGNSLKEIFDLKLAKEKVATAQLEIVAQDFLKKWYGKVRHQFSPLDKTSAFRLDIYKLTDETMVLIDKVMNSLEKEMNTTSLEPLMKLIDNNMHIIRKLLNALESTLRGQDFDKPFMKLLEKGDVTEYGRNFSDKEKSRLETALERKRMTDLSRLYFNSGR